MEWGASATPHTVAGGGQGQFGCGLKTKPKTSSRRNGAPLSLLQLGDVREFWMTGGGGGGGGSSSSS